MEDDIELLAKSAGADGFNEISDTPRTDRQTYFWQTGGNNPFVHREFAQDLERKNAAMRALLDNVFADTMLEEAILIESLRPLYEAICPKPVESDGLKNQEQQ
jgi:hypothetical protein